MSQFGWALPSALLSMLFFRVITSRCRIASRFEYGGAKPQASHFDDAMILPHAANLEGSKFSEWTAVASAGMAPTAAHCPLLLKLGLNFARPQRLSSRGERPSFASAAAKIMYEILNPGFAADRSPHSSGFGGTPDKLEAAGFT